jgi:hypothetical protein
MVLARLEACAPGRKEAVILRTILRLLWVAVAFWIAAGTALAVLFTLGAIWTGDELRNAAPDDPMLRHGGAHAFGLVLFAGTVAPALTAIPALIAVVAGEVLRLRSWMYYVLTGGASLLAVPLLTTARDTELSELPASPYMTVFAAAGFAGGFVYWLLAGSRA